MKKWLEDKIKDGITIPLFGLTITWGKGKPKVQAVKVGGIPVKKSRPDSEN